MGLTHQFLLQRTNGEEICLYWVRTVSKIRIKQVQKSGLKWRTYKDQSEKRVKIPVSISASVRKKIVVFKKPFDLFLLDFGWLESTARERSVWLREHDRNKKLQHTEMTFDDAESHVRTYHRYSVFHSIESLTYFFASFFTPNDKVKCYSW